MESKTKAEVFLAEGGGRTGNYEDPVSKGRPLAKKYRVIGGYRPKAYRNARTGGLSHKARVALILGARRKALDVLLRPIKEEI